MDTNEEDRIARRAIIKARREFAVKHGFTHGAVFELTQDVTNPGKNARHKKDWRYHAVISQGTRFRVFMPEDPDLGPNPTFAKIGSWDHFSVGVGSALWPILVPHLRLVPPTPQERLNWLKEEKYVGPGAMLIELIATGRLTWEDVEQTAQILRDRPEKED